MPFSVQFFECRRRRISILTSRCRYANIWKSPGDSIAVGCLQMAVYGCLALTHTFITQQRVILYWLVTYLNGKANIKRNTFEDYYFIER
jgi:hypothetical protein